MVHSFFYSQVFSVRLFKFLLSISTISCSQVFSYGFSEVFLKQFSQNFFIGFFTGFFRGVVQAIFLNFDHRFFHRVFTGLFQSQVFHRVLNFEIFSKFRLCKIHRVFSCHRIFHIFFTAFSLVFIQNVVNTLMNPQQQSTNLACTRRN